ncbi:MAG: hypothetical protein Q4F07_03375 [Bacteroidales bacterium]|nr:hypothetical protein [Bacteroidales bacterium]
MRGVLLHYDERLRSYNVNFFLSAYGGDGIPAVTGRVMCVPMLHILYHYRVSKPYYDN